VPQGALRSTASGTAGFIFGLRGCHRSGGGGVNAVAQPQPGEELFLEDDAAPVIDLSIQRRYPARMPLKPMTFRLETEILAQLSAIRERDGIPVSEQVRRALLIWIREKGVRTTPWTHVKRQR
jgi:hypothetical protein